MQLLVQRPLPRSFFICWILKLVDSDSYVWLNCDFDAGYPYPLNSGVLTWFKRFLRWAVRLCICWIVWRPFLASEMCWFCRVSLLLFETITGRAMNCVLDFFPIFAGNCKGSKSLFKDLSRLVSILLLEDGPFRVWYWERSLVCGGSGGAVGSSRPRGKFSIILGFKAISYR